MRILLVTKAPNGIQKYLQDREDIILMVVNCNNNSDVVLANLRDMLNEEDVDVIITYRCPIILPSDIFLKAKLVAFNIQASLLPKYPVCNPWETICLNHDKKSGVTFHKLDVGTCTGKTIIQREFEANSIRSEISYIEIVEKYAIILLDDMLFAFDNTRYDKLNSSKLRENGSNLNEVSMLAKHFFSSGYINGKLDLPDISTKDFEYAFELYKTISHFYESKEQFQNALTQNIFVLFLSMKIYGKVHERTASCYEYAAELQAKLGMEEKAMNSQRMANEIRERIYGFSHERYIQGLQKFGEIGFLIGEYKRRNGKV